MKVTRWMESQKNGKFLKDFTGTTLKGPLNEGAGSRSETGGVCDRANQLPPALRATPLEVGGFKNGSLKFFFPPSLLYFLTWYNTQKLLFLSFFSPLFLI
ncbi:MAG: hypothetical protein IJK97_04765 [Thermoguttaceae bacterium]|nr:hypothetical protein [Thermoguttaceae bacterium]